MGYVHGYSGREQERLQDQAGTLAELLHHDTRYPAGASVLEAGCGVGAQTVILARNSPEAHFVSVDLSEPSLASARAAIAAQGSRNVTFQRADLFALPFPAEHFDHVFVCFVLEHLAEPERALRCVRDVLKPGGTLTVIEGDHGSTFFHPASADAWRTIQCLIDVQARLGANALIGRQVYPLLAGAGLRDVTVSPRMVYADATRPAMVDGFTRKTFIAMVEGVRPQAIELGLIDADAWAKGIRDLNRTTEPDGVFCYTFFKGVGVKS